MEETTTRQKNVPVVIIVEGQDIIYLNAKQNREIGTQLGVKTKPEDIVKDIASQKIKGKINEGAKGMNGVQIGKHKVGGLRKSTENRKIKVLQRTPKVPWTMKQCSVIYLKLVK